MIDIKVGDYIRWDSQYGNGLWAEGEILALPDDESGRCAVRLTSACNDIWSWRERNPAPLTFRLTDPGLRRIERPADHGDEVVIYCHQDLGNGKRCRLPLGHTNGVHLCGKKYTGEPRWERLYDKPCTLNLGHDGKHSSGNYAWDDNPALIDGLTVKQCDINWCRNRDNVENGHPPPCDMTPAQIEAGRQAYQMRVGQYDSSRLAKLQAEDRERERLQVVVDMDVD